MKNKQRRALTMGWNGITAIALLCLSLLGGQCAAFAADPGVTASTVEVVPYQASGYRYSVIDYATQTTRPNVGFEQPEFDDSQWSAGQASFGSGGYCPLQTTKHVTWPVSTEIYVRRKVIIPEGATNIRIMAAADNDILAFFDGVPLGGTITHEDCPVLDEFRLDVEPFAGEVEAGEHVLSFYIKDRGVESFFDMRLLVDVASGAGVKVNFTGLPRACAGGVDDLSTPSTDDDAHIFVLQFNAKDGNQNLANKALAFSFTNNQSHVASKKAKFLISSNPRVWAETTTATTDGNGNGNITVLSSDIISNQTKISVKYGGAEIGSMTCDFAEAVTFRNFPNQYDPNEAEDLGWIFDFPNLVDPENQEQITPAKVYLKFKIYPDKGDDYTFTGTDGQVHGNWKFVNGHNMHIYVAGVKLYGNPDDETFYDGPEIFDTPSNLRHYAFIKDQRGSVENISLNTVDRLTVQQGETAPQVFAKAGPDIENVAILWIDAEDLTQRKP